MDLRRIGIVGSAGVGKSTLVEGYLSSSSLVKHVAYRRRSFALKFVESELDDLHIQQLDAVMVVFDLTDEHSFEECMQVLDNFTQPFVLVGNKADEESSRQVSSLVATRRAVQSKCVYTECSARYSDHIDSCLFLLLDLLIDAKQVGTCWEWWPPGPRGREVLQGVTCILAIATMLQGLGMCMYGGYFIVHMDDKSTDWLGDAFIWSGTLTFIMSFLGFYGSKEAIKEYLKVVISTQYAVLSLLEALSKVMILVIFAFSSLAHPHMYETIERGRGFRSMLGACMALELVASAVAVLYMKAFTQAINQASYSTLVTRV